jgi:hypothetical protein
LNICRQGTGSLALKEFLRLVISEGFYHGLNNNAWRYYCQVSCIPAYLQMTPACIL